MNLLDALLILLVVSAAVGGYRLGFVARAASWLGLGLGIFVAARLAPAVMQTAGGADPILRLFFVAILFLVAAALGGTAGELLGARLRMRLPRGSRWVDQGLGAGAGVVGTVLVVWLLLPALAEVPGEPSRLARRSALAQALDRATPPPPDTLQALRRLIGDEAFPQVFEQLRPAPDTGPPPSGSVLSPAVRARVTASTVKVSGVACRRVQEGSGFTPAPDTIVTNAHVVAGIDRPEVLRPDGRRLRGQVVRFDANRDLAVLRVPGLGQSPLPVGTGEVGEVGAVFGHPRGQVPVREAPAQIQRRVTAVGRDIYNSRPTSRQVFFLASDLQPGDSGGALVDGGGAVVGVAFAIAPDRDATAYALTSDELRAVLAGAGSAGGAGPCLR
jgi:S1-C subfamily serine protease